jgi:hypothetical protein
VVLPADRELANLYSSRDVDPQPDAPERLVDAKGRPYFLWDDEMTLDEFRARLRDGDPEVRAYLLGKLLRQAKPDDVFQFVRLAEVVELWPKLERYLGRTRDMWRWLLDGWTGTRRVAR